MKINQNPVVFISYAHEGDLGKRVGALAAWFTEHGIQVITDHPYVNRPPENGWRAWMQHHIEDADMVLIVCSERYKNLFEKREVADAGGRGATWESAIITDDLYSSRLNNRRFYPILPDNGEHSHVPRILNDWHNNHRFPSGNQRILALIREEITIPTPTQPFLPLLLGELSGSSDSRLSPREGEVIGREEELAEVMAFLTGDSPSATVCGHVTGSGGIGKTEVCKAALKRWLNSDSATRAFWVQVSDDADSLHLLGLLGTALDLPPETIAKITEISQLRPYLREGLYYLDNLESVAEAPGDIQLLRELVQIPGIRLLASSRVALDGVLGSSIPIDRLDADSAVKLFLKCWTGRDTLNLVELKPFVDQQLGGHALSITLLARLGRAYGWQTLQNRWYEQGTASAQIHNTGHRLDSLEISFALTEKSLVEKQGALDLWQFVALFPNGLDEESLNLWGEISGQQDARFVLAEHHLLSLDAGHITMLPPVARYALGHVANDTSAGSGFNWEQARKHAYHYFIALSYDASATVSSDANILSRTQSSQQLWAIEKLCKTDLACASSNIELARQLHRQLNNVYAFNVLAGQAVLSSFNKLLGDALSSERLGDLESRLGNVDLARGHYDKAIELYNKEQDQLGLANAYQSLGDLLLSIKHLEEALSYYQDAVSLYRTEQDPMGQAYTLAEIIRCLYRLGGLGSDELRKLALDALEQADKSGIESVTNYVVGALFEACENSKDKL